MNFIATTPLNGLHNRRKGVGVVAHLENRHTMHLLEHYLNGYTPTLPLTSTIAYKSFPCKCTKWAVDNQETLTGFSYRNRWAVELLKYAGVKHVERTHKNPYVHAGATVQPLCDLIHVI